MDKLTETYTLRIPQSLKDEIETTLSDDQKKEMNHQIMVTIAKAIHSAKFNPEVYLGK